MRQYTSTFQAPEEDFYAPRGMKNIIMSNEMWRFSFVRRL